MGVYRDKIINEPRKESRGVITCCERHKNPRPVLTGKKIEDDNFNCFSLLENWRFFFEREIFSDVFWVTLFSWYFT